MISFFMKFYSNFLRKKNSLSFFENNINKKEIKFINNVINYKTTQHFDSEIFCSFNHRDNYQSLSLDCFSAKIIFRIYQDLNFEKYINITFIKSYGHPIYLGNGKFAGTSPEITNNFQVKLTEFYKFWNENLKFKIFPHNLNDLPENIRRQGCSPWIWNRYPELVS